MGKLRPKEEKELVQGHSAVSEGQWGLNSAFRFSPLNQDPYKPGAESGDASPKRMKAFVWGRGVPSLERSLGAENRRQRVGLALG